MDKPGYHLKDIKKGTIWQISKIREELEELEDAYDQGSKIIQFVELADLYGAIEEFASRYGLTMQDLADFSDITKRAFFNGKKQ